MRLPIAPYDRHERSIAWLAEKLFSGPQVRRWNVFASISFHRAQPQSRRWLVPPPTAPWNQKVSLWGSRGGEPKGRTGTAGGPASGFGGEDRTGGWTAFRKWPSQPRST